MRKMICAPLLFACLLFAALPSALAGHYKRISYSGGTETISGPGWSDSFPYEERGDGWGGGYPSGTSTGTATSSCSGEVTVTFVWVEDYPNEPPPLNAIMEEEVSVSWAVSGTTNRDGSRNHGLSSNAVFIASQST